MSRVNRNLKDNEGSKAVSKHQCMIRKKNIALDQSVPYLIRNAWLKPHQPFPQGGDGAHLRDMEKKGVWEMDELR